MSATVAYHHIGFQGDQPVVRPYGIKLTQLVVEHLVHGWSPTELCYQHPGLEMGQVHSALAYYWDHKEEVDAMIEDVDKRVGRIRESLPSQVLQDRLSALKG